MTAGAVIAGDSVIANVDVLKHVSVLDSITHNNIAYLHSTTDKQSSSSVSTFASVKSQWSVRVDCSKLVLMSQSPLSTC